MGALEAGSAAGLTVPPCNGLTAHQQLNAVPYKGLTVLQACPCTHAAVCKADTFDLMDKKCRFKHNPVGSWNFIHGGG